MVAFLTKDKTRWVMLLALWHLCLIVAYLCFFMFDNKYGVDLTNVLSYFGPFFVGTFALPISFFQVLSSQDFVYLNEIPYSFFLIVLYWSSLVFLQYKWIKTGNKYMLIVMFAVLVISSRYWILQCLEIMGI